MAGSAQLQTCTNNIQCLYMHLGSPGALTREDGGMAYFKGSPCLDRLLEQGVQNNVGVSSTSLPSSLKNVMCLLHSSLTPPSLPPSFPHKNVMCLLRFSLPSSLPLKNVVCLSPAISPFLCYITSSLSPPPPLSLSLLFIKCIRTNIINPCTI